MTKKLFCMAMVLTVLMSSLALPVNAQKFVQPKPTNLLILGDSISTGYGLSSGQLSYGQQLAKAFGLNSSAYTNLAVDGADSNSLLKKIKTQAAQSAIQAADTIVLSIGGNDVLGLFLNTLKRAAGNPEYSPTQLEAAIAADPITTLTAVSQALADPAIQAKFVSANQNFAKNFSDIIDNIQAMNPTAKIYVQTVYNPFKGVFGLDSISKIAEDTIQGDEKRTGLNNIIAHSNLTGQYTVVDIHALFFKKSLLFTNMVNYDIHPSGIGHTAIFNSVYKAITGEAYFKASNSNAGTAVRFIQFNKRIFFDNHNTYFLMTNYDIINLIS